MDYETNALPTELTGRRAMERWRYSTIHKLYVSHVLFAKVQGQSTEARKGDKNGAGSWMCLRLHSSTICVGIDARPHGVFIPKDLNVRGLNKE